MPFLRKRISGYLNKKIRMHRAAASEARVRAKRATGGSEIAYGVKDRQHAEHLAEKAATAQSIADWHTKKMRRLQRWRRKITPDPRKKRKK